MLKARLEKYRIDNREIKRWGAFTSREWNATQEFLLDSKLISEKRDISLYYTEQFLDQINDFDQQAVIDQARAY